MKTIYIMLEHNMYNSKGELHFQYYTPTPIYTSFVINPSIRAHTVSYTYSDTIYSWKKSSYNSWQYYTDLSVHLTKAVQNNNNAGGYCLTLYK